MSLEWVLLGLRIVTTVILYAFLGVAFYLIWRDLQAAGDRRWNASAPITHQLRVIDPAGESSLRVDEVLPLQPVTLLGRAPENTIILSGPAIAAHHTRLTRQEGVWWLEDLGSQAGTRLNEARLLQPAPLRDGDTIGLGPVCFRLEPLSPAR